MFASSAEADKREDQVSESTEVEMQEEPDLGKQQQEEEKREEAEPQIEERKMEDEEKPAADANKPVAINSVVGTPWCVVWTGDMRSFFYNAVSKESHWIMPDELKDNEQVDKLLEQPPKQKGRVFPCQELGFLMVSMVFISPFY